MTDSTIVNRKSQAGKALRAAAANGTNAGSLLRSFDELKLGSEGTIDWLWQGYLAAGDITLLTSFWKTGKTTLISVLISKLKQGGTFAGLPLRAGKAAIISEESPRLWLERGQKLEFGTHVQWLCRPFRGKPTHEQWEALIDQLVEQRSRAGLDLVAIDPLAVFLPVRSENEADGMTRALLPLRRLADAGAAVLILHHPRRKQSAAGQLARGSGVLSGFADILIEMHVQSRDATDRRRRLQAFSRHETTPAHILIELNAAGTDYACLGNFDGRTCTDSWQALERIFTHAHDKLTCKQILDDWPDDNAKPAEFTLRRWLQQAQKDNLVLRDGHGTKTKPFRYWVKSREKK